MTASLQAAVERARRRSPVLDHGVRAAGRFFELNGTRLAAAVTYYAFLAIFPSLSLAFSVLGFVVNNDPAVIADVQAYVERNLPIPGFDVGSIAGNRRAAGIIGIVGLFYAGLVWVDVVRTSIRAMWHRDEQPNSFPITTLIDLLVLLGFGAVLLLSLGLTVAVTAGAEWLVGLVGLGSDTTRVPLTVLGIVLGVVVNGVLFVALLTGLPRLKMSFGRVWPAALVGALGLEVLKVLGTLYIDRASANPLYKTVVGTVGLLLFLNLLNLLILFCAAWTATGVGGVRDLATQEDLPPGGETRDAADGEGGGAAGDGAAGEDAAVSDRPGRSGAADEDAAVSDPPGRSGAARPAAP